MHTDQSDSGIAFALTQEITHLRDLLHYWKDGLAAINPFSEQLINLAVEGVERLPYRAQRVCWVNNDDQDEADEANRDEDTDLILSRLDHDHNSDNESMITMSDTESIMEMRDVPI